MSAQLEAKIAELEDELYYYRNLFTEPSEALAGPLRKHGLMPREVKAARLFLVKPHVSRDALMAVLGEDFCESYPQVIIHALRRKLKPHGITIKTIRSFGWIMEKDSQQRLAALVTPPASPASDPLRAAFNRAKLRGL